MADPASYGKLPSYQEARFLAFDKSLKSPEQRLLASFKAAYKETIGQMESLYRKVGLKTPVDGMSIRKEDAIRYRQLDNRLAAIAVEMRKLRDKGVKLTGDTSAQAIQDAYYGNQWAFEQAVQVPLPIPVLPAAAIRRAVASDDTGLTYIERWGKNISGSQSAVQATIVRGLTQGYSYSKMASEIKGQFDKGLADAIRVVRTEAGRCWSAGAQAAHDEAEDAGLKLKKRWSAALDDRTRPSHAALDGEYADEDGLFWIGNLSAQQPREFGDPAEDINCRCAAIDVLDGIEPSVRRIRGEDPNDGYSSENAPSGIVPYQTFRQWAEPKGWTEARGWPKK